MKHFPIFINIKNKPILIIGGGNVALRKAKSIVSAGGKVTLIADNVLSEINNLDNIRVIQRFATCDDISKNYKFIVIATNNNQANETFAKHCMSLDIIFNRVDEYDSNSFITGSTIDIEPVLIAISSGAPEMSKLIKTQINKVLSPDLIQLANLLNTARPRLKQSCKGRLLMKKLATVETLQEISQNGFEQIAKEVNLCL